MKCLNALLYFAILGGDSFVLAQVVGPRFSHKALDVPLRVRCIAQVHSVLGRFVGDVSSR